MNPPKTPNFRGFTFSQSANFYPYFCEKLKTPERPTVGTFSVLICQLLFLICNYHTHISLKEISLKERRRTRSQNDTTRS